MRFPGSALVGDHGGALATVFEWTHTLRYVLLALNCALVLVFMGVMRNGAKQFDRYEERAKKYGELVMKRDRNVLFVIAHPDDEAMFFVPSILSLGEFEGYCLHVLCLSSGNFDGLGETRSKELLESCRILGISEDRVCVVEDPELQDGMKSEWPATAVKRTVSKQVDKWGIHSIVTFDEGGVSGHPNHIDTCRGVEAMFEEDAFRVAHPDFRLWELRSTSLLRKYSGVFDLLVSSWDPGVFFCVFRPMINYMAMNAHFSQFVWYRRLFIVFSRYGYMNNLREYAAKDEEKNGEEKRVLLAVHHSSVQFPSD